MATPEERVRAAIAKIDKGRRSVRLADIDRVITHLRDDLGYAVSKSGKNNHFTYTVADGDESYGFQVCDHHKGQSQLLVCYVTQFLNCMSALGLLD